MIAHSDWCDDVRITSLLHVVLEINNDNYVIYDTQVVVVMHAARDILETVLPLLPIIQNA